jgi:hypothetical protein
MDRRCRQIVYSSFSLDANIFIAGTHALYHSLLIRCPATQCLPPSMEPLNFLSCALVGYIFVTPSLWIEVGGIQPSGNEVQSLSNMSISRRGSWGKDRLWPKGVGEGMSKRTTRPRSMGVNIGKQISPKLAASTGSNIRGSWHFFFLWWWACKTDKAPKRVVM